MKHFLKNLLLFAFATLPVMLATDLLLSRWMKASNFPNSVVIADVMGGSIDADIAVFGNSRAMTGFDPAVCDSITALSSYDIIAAGGNFQPHSIMENMYFRHNRMPRAVVQFIDSWWFVSGLTYNHTNSYLPWMTDREFFKEALRLGPVFIVDHSIPVLRYHSTRIWSDNGKHIKTYKGHFVYKNSSFNPEARPDSLIFVRSLPLERQFREQIARMKACGIKVVLVYPPLYRTFSPTKKAQREMERFYGGIAEEFDIPILDYRELDLKDDPTKFIDEGHLNKDGARILTDTLSKDLLRILGR